MRKDTHKELTLSTYFAVERSVPEDWVSQAEAARIRGVSRQAIARLVRKGRFQVLRIGGKILLKRADVNAYEPEQPGRPRK
jgi:excisionase family DNA binding protein